MDLPPGCPKKAKDKQEVLGECFYTDMEVWSQIGVHAAHDSKSTLGKGEDAGGLKKRGKVGESIEESAGAADLKARIYLITE